MGRGWLRLPDRFSKRADPLNGCLYDPVNPVMIVPTTALACALSPSR